jgi:exonuclease SbcC
MKLKLKNFRCHESAEFQIDDSGLILLSGPSGTGKSTVLKAIIYALYGKIRKPYSFGAKSCSVTLEFMDMKIIRTSNPNRLMVYIGTATTNPSSPPSNPTAVGAREPLPLEDEPAQHFINERLGMTYQEFMLSSYIPQKNNTSILSMTQSEQTAVIQMIAFKDDQNEQLGKKLKDLIKGYTTQVANYKTKLDLATTEVVNLSEGLVQVQFPLTLQDSETNEECIKTYRNRLKTFNSRISELYDQQEVLTKELSDLKATQDQIDSLMSKRDSVVNPQADEARETLATLRCELELLPVNLDSKINTLKTHLKCMEKKTALESMELTLETSMTLERDNRKNRITEIDQVLWLLDDKLVSPQTLEAEIADNETKISIFEDYQTTKKIYLDTCMALGETPDAEAEGDLDIGMLLEKLLEKIELTTTEIEDLNAKRTEWAVNIERLNLAKERIECPKCNTGLRFHDGKLSCFETDFIETSDTAVDYPQLISDATKKLKLLESERKGVQSLYNKIETLSVPEVNDQTDPEFYDALASRNDELSSFLKKHRDLQQQRNRLQKELDNESFGPAIKGMKEAFSKETINFEALLKGVIDSDLMKTRDVLDTELTELLDLKMKRGIKVSEVTEAEKRLKNVNEQLTAINKQISTLNGGLSGINRSNILKKLEKVDTKIKLAKTKQDEDTSISEQVDSYLTWVERSQKLAEWTVKLEEYSEGLKKAEGSLVGFMGLKDMLARAEVLAVDNVVSTINEHTAYYLDTFFGDHKLSAVIGTSPEAKFANTIEYKGNEYAGVTELSGGEFDRVTLASVCGVNAMMNSPILILDESLSSLDAETNTEIINFLHELSENKLILVCSHEAVTGIFDEVIAFD